MEIAAKDEHRTCSNCKKLFKNTNSRNIHVKKASCFETPDDLKTLRLRYTTKAYFVSVSLPVDVVTRINQLGVMFTSRSEFMRAAVIDYMIHGNVSELTLDVLPRDKSRTVTVPMQINMVKLIDTCCNNNRTSFIRACTIRYLQLLKGV